MLDFIKKNIFYSILLMSLIILSACSEKLSSTLEDEQLQELVGVVTVLSETSDISDTEVVGTSTSPREPLVGATIQLKDAITNKIFDNVTCSITSELGQYQCDLKNLPEKDHTDLLLVVTKKQGDKVTVLSRYIEEITKNNDIDGDTAVIANYMQYFMMKETAGLLKFAKQFDNANKEESVLQLRLLHRALLAANINSKQFASYIDLQDGELAEQSHLIRSFKEAKKIESDLGPNHKAVIQKYEQSLKTNLRKLAEEASYLDEIHTMQLPKRFDCADVSITLPKIQLSDSQKMHLNRCLNYSQYQGKALPGKVVFGDDVNQQTLTSNDISFTQDNTTLSLDKLSIKIKSIYEYFLPKSEDEGSKNVIEISQVSSDYDQALFIMRSRVDKNPNVMGDIFKWIIDGERSFNLRTKILQVNNQDVIVYEKDFGVVSDKFENPGSSSDFIDKYSKDFGQFYRKEYFFPRNVVKDNFSGLKLAYMVTDQDKETVLFDELLWDFEPHKISATNVVSIFDFLTSNTFYQRFKEETNSNDYISISFNRSGSCELENHLGEKNIFSCDWSLTENSAQDLVLSFNYSSNAYEYIVDITETGYIQFLNEETTLLLHQGKVRYSYVRNESKKETLMRPFEGTGSYLEFDYAKNTLIEKSSNEEDEYYSFSYEGNDKTQYVITKIATEQVGHFATRIEDGVLIFKSIKDIKNGVVTEFKFSESGLYLGDKKYKESEPENIIEEKIVIHFEDENLKKLVMKKLPYDEEFIYIDDVINIKALTHNPNDTTSGIGAITNLKGLEHFTSLESINFGKNNILDLSPLKDMTNLKQLNFDENPVKDISFLEKLTELEVLQLGGISEQNTESLSVIKNFSQLEELDLSYQNNSDFSFLTELAHLKYVDLSYNKLENLDFLNGSLAKIELLALMNNNLLSLKSLSQAALLKEIHVDEKIQDIFILENLNSLNKLAYGINNYINDDVKVFFDKIKRYKLSSSVNTSTLNKNFVPTLDTDKVYVFDRVAKQVYYYEENSSVQLWTIVSETDTEIVLRKKNNDKHSEHYFKRYENDRLVLDLKEVNYVDVAGVSVKKEYGYEGSELILTKTYFNNVLKTVTTYGYPNNKNALYSIAYHGNDGIFSYIEYFDNSGIKEYSTEELGQVISFKDDALEKVVKSSISDFRGDYVYEEQVKDIKTLTHNPNDTTSGIGAITNLKGLEHFTSLESINFENNQIANLEPLKDLITLTEFNFNGNLIENISSLEKLINLKALKLGHSETSIVDFSVIKKFSDLEEINLSHHNYGDFSFLSELSHLKDVDLSHNEIVNLDFLKKSMSSLKVLNLLSNNIVSISPLSQANNLERLRIDDKVKDLLPLKSKSKLEYLTYGGESYSNSNVVKTFLDQIEVYEVDASYEDGWIRSTKTNNVWVIDYISKLLYSINGEVASGQYVITTFSDSELTLNYVSEGVERLMTYEKYWEQDHLFLLIKENKYYDPDHGNVTEVFEYDGRIITKEKMYEDDVLYSVENFGEPNDPGVLYSRVFYNADGSVKYTHYHDSNGDFYYSSESSQ